MILVERLSGLIIAANNRFLKVTRFTKEDIRFLSILEWVEMKELPKRGMQRSGRVRDRFDHFYPATYDFNPLIADDGQTIVDGFLSVIIYLAKDNN